MKSGCDLRMVISGFILSYLESLRLKSSRRSIHHCYIARYLFSPSHAALHSVHVQDFYFSCDSARVFGQIRPLSHLRSLIVSRKFLRLFLQSPGSYREESRRNKSVCPYRLTSRARSFANMAIRGTGPFATFLIIGRESHHQPSFSNKHSLPPQQHASSSASSSPSSPTTTTSSGPPPHPPSPPTPPPSTPATTTSPSKKTTSDSCTPLPPS